MVAFIDGAADLRAAGVCSSSFVVALVEECDALAILIDAATMACPRHGFR